VTNWNGASRIVETGHAGETASCVACGCDWRFEELGAGILSTTITDESGDAPHITFGNPQIAIARLCGRCIEAIGTSGLLRFVPVSLGYPITTLTTKDGDTFLGHVKLAPQSINPPTWFEGRAASLAEHYKEQSVLRGYCEQMERRGLRVVAAFSSEADRQAVYHFGLMFGQEAPSGPPNVFVHPRLIGLTRIAYLVKNPEGSEYVGAISFETYPKNTLVWVYVRPDFRRRKILSHHWPTFESAHANFRVLTPLSEAMKGFLFRHHGHELTETT